MEGGSGSRFGSSGVGEIGAGGSPSSPASFSAVLRSEEDRRASRETLSAIQVELRRALHNHQYLTSLPTKVRAMAENKKKVEDVQDKISRLTKKQDWLVGQLRQEISTELTDSAPTQFTASGAIQNYLVYHYNTQRVAEGGPPGKTEDGARGNKVIMSPIVEPAFKAVGKDLNEVQSTSVARPVEAAGKVAAVKVTAELSAKGMNAPKAKLTNSADAAQHSQESSGLGPVNSMGKANAPGLLKGSLSMASGDKKVAPAGINAIPTDVLKPLAPIEVAAAKASGSAPLPLYAISNVATEKAHSKVVSMSPLDLVTADTAKEAERKRSERKRRTTANPVFSSHSRALRSKTASASHEAKKEVDLSSPSSGPRPVIKKRRGRPRKTAACTVKKATVVKNEAGVVVSDSDDHEDFCAMCTLSGKLLLCDACNLVYHLRCLKPVLTAVPEGFWSCPKCVSDAAPVANRTGGEGGPSAASGPAGANGKGAAAK